MTNTIGTCSLCGGRVVMPMHSVNPVPVCESCGARAANPYGPVIPMQPAKTNRPVEMGLSGNLIVTRKDGAQ